MKRISLRGVEVGACGIGSAADVVGYTKDVRVRFSIVLWAEMRLGDVVVCGTGDWNATDDTIWGLAITTSELRVRIAIRPCRFSCPRPVDAGASVADVTELETLAVGIGVRRLRVIANQVQTWRRSRS